MTSRLEKIVRAFILGILMFAIPSSEPETALARTRRRYKVQAKETVTRFLSSVRLVKKAYDFDHDGDGVVDMSVYPLRTDEPDLESKYLTLEEAISKKQLIIKENPSLSVVRKEPPSSYSVFGQYWGSGSIYSPRGGQLRGGYQNSGFGRGGVLGGGSYSRRSYGGSGAGRGRSGRGYYGYEGFIAELVLKTATWSGVVSDVNFSLDEIKTLLNLRSNRDSRLMLCVLKNGD